MRNLTLATLCAAAAVSLSAQQAPVIQSIDLSAINKAADPCQDFYQYACGTWIQTHPIPPDQAVWSRFSELAERNREILRGILEKAAAPSADRSNVDQKIGDYYAACMDEKTANDKGISPITPELDRIRQLSGKPALAAEVAHLHQIGVPVFFLFSSGQDAKNATQMIAQTSQGGLSLPDREYYLRADPKSVEIRDKYKQHLRNMFQLAGDPPERAAAEADTVLSIETALAQASLDRVSLRDPNKRYHKMSVSELAALTPSFAWSQYLPGTGVRLSSLNVSTPEFFQQGMEKVIANTPLEQLQTYLRWHVIHDAAPLLSQQLIDENFAFFGRALTGAKELQARWKRCTILVDRQLGEALGQAYVKQAFSPQAKERTLQMVGEIEKEMAKDVQSLPWMSATTKEQALAKLHQVANKIGYPEHWRDYSPVRIRRNDLLGDNYRASEFNRNFRLAEIGKPVDKQEWGMTPPTVNAYYSPTMNNINFPAGILQPPFYYAGGDEAVNYGAIGAVVGHELTHGFDDQGRQFDGAGNLRDWWTAEDTAAFKERADCIANEYSNFVAAGDVKLNGRLTLGENAADNGGIRLAYMAMLDSLDRIINQKKDGYTPQQRFFLGYSQIWCQNQTEQAARNQALTNPHSLGRYRVNGVLQNMPEFQQAFGCKVGQPMVSERACRVW